MIPVGGDRQAVLLTPQLLPPKLISGGQVHAAVLSSNRRGVSVQIGQETFQLNVASSLAEAKTLILRGSGSSVAAPEAWIQVKIVAVDDHPLSRPIFADLAAVKKPATQAVSTIVQANRLDVPAQPLNAGGQAVGATVTLRLQTVPVEQVVNEHTAKPSTLANNLASKTPGQPLQMQTMVQQPAKSSLGPLRPPQPGGSLRHEATGGKHTIGDDVAKPRFVPEGQAKVGEGKHNLPIATPIASSRLVGSSLPSVSEPQSEDASAPQRRTAREPTVQGKVKSPSTKIAPSANQDTSVRAPATDSKSMMRPAPPIEPQIAGNRETPGAAVVVDRTSADKIILEAEGQLYRVEKPLDLPVGMTLQATLAAGASALSFPVLLGGNQDLATPLAKLIELLNDVDRAGQQATEPDRSSPARQLPLPDKNLMSRFLNLLTYQDGDLRLDGRGQPSERAAITALQKEQIQMRVREVGSVASEPLADGWKSQGLPLGSDPSQAISLFYRDQELDPDESTADEDVEHSKTQRAVFDVTLSRLGRCQIDTLCQERQFDLFIRSERPLLPDDRQQITVLFTSASEIAGLHGDIVFKVGSFFEPPRSSVAMQDLRT